MKLSQLDFRTLEKLLDDKIKSLSFDIEISDYPPDEEAHYTQELSLLLILKTKIELLKNAQ